MAEPYLATYLNDHLAGSEGALELLEHLERAHAGTPLAHFAAELWADIVADRRELEALMTRLQVAVSRPRKAAAWLSEKVTELKLRLDDPPGGALRQLEVLEAVSLGIEGKRLLWRSLGVAAEGTPDLGGTDYGRRERRAEEQRRCVETVRLGAARAALGSAPSADRAPGADETTI
jgi:hypothetical protein